MSSSIDLKYEACFGAIGADTSKSWATQTADIDMDTTSSSNEGNTHSNDPARDETNGKDLKDSNAITIVVLRQNATPLLPGQHKTPLNRFYQQFQNVAKYFSGLCDLWPAFAKFVSKSS